MGNYGLKMSPNKGRDLFSELNGVKYARYPIQTTTVKIGDSLDDFVKTYAVPYLKKGDILCISAKVVSISKALVLHESEVKISLLARLIVKFVKKWPGDIGYSHPRKMQAAINQIGYPRTIVALVGGVVMKVFKKPGYFYIIAGNNINAIDGFNPVSKPPMNEYAVLPPKNGDEISDDLESKFGFPIAILDGNNIDNNVLGMSQSVKEKFNKDELMSIVKGNPQGQEDDGAITPMLVVREVKG